MDTTREACVTTLMRAGVRKGRLIGVEASFSRLRRSIQLPVNKQPTKVAAIASKYSA